MADSDNPFASTGKTKRKRRRNVCLGATAATIILLIIIALILALTVFKAKRPITTVNSVSIDDLTVALDLIKLRPKLNLTLDLNLAIKNPNKVGLRYSDSSAALNYRGLQVGEVPIPAGRISADSTTPMNLTLTLMADRLLSNSQLYSDVLSGELRLNSYAKITGKVTVFNIKVTSTSTCDFTVFLSNRTVGDQTCNYKTKL